jgi:hypothetical protein
MRAWRLRALRCKEFLRATPNNGQIGTSIAIKIVVAGLLGGGAEASSVALAGAAALISSSTATKVGIIAVAGAAWTGGVDNVITSNTGAGVASVNG